MAARYQHSIRFDPDRCNGCMSCMRVCPTAAVRVHKGRAVKLEDRCIDCGECIRVCPSIAILPLTDQLADLSKFDCTIAIPSPTLYAQFDDETLPGAITSALKRCGFSEVECVSSACDLATVATEMYLNDYRGPSPLIASFCPTIVRLVQVKYPELVGQLMPILAPREIAARDAKTRKSQETGLPPERIGAIYITPCPSKVVAILEHPGSRRSYLDAAVSISDIFQTLAGAVSKIGEPKDNLDGGETASGVGWAFLGGLPRFLPAENTLAVAGLPNVIRILDDVEKGRLQKYAFIECHACAEGCVGGPLTVEDPYVARAKTIKLMQKLPARPTIDRERIEEQYREGSFLMDEPLTSRPLLPLDQDISRAIVKMKERDRIFAGLPQIDCGACGAPTCRAFAEDLVLGGTEESDCVFFYQRERAQERDRIAENRGGMR
jgi:NAD-dependent dihydropyrimidine dehydrogenase PreA subunit